METILAIVKEPGKAPRARSIENTPASLRKVVGGEIAAIQIDDEVTLLCCGSTPVDELQANISVPNSFFVMKGTVVVVRSGRHGEFESLTPENQTEVRKMLRRHAV